MGYDIRQLEGTLPNAKAYTSETRDKAFGILSKGMGQVMSCLHDVVGSDEDYSKIVDEYRVERTLS